MNKVRRSESGVTLLSLVIYCVIMVLVMGIIGVITQKVSTEVSEMGSYRSYVLEINKLSMYMLEEAKNSSNRISKVSDTGIEFSNGNKYIYMSADEAIYKVDNTGKKFKICTNVYDCRFEHDIQNRKDIVRAQLTFSAINSTVRTMEYVMAS